MDVITAVKERASYRGRYGDAPVPAEGHAKKPDARLRTWILSAFRQ